MNKPLIRKGSILRVNLTENTIIKSDLDQDVARQFIGGRGYGIHTLLNELDAQCDALSPQNIMVMATGPLTGTRAQTGARYMVTTKSPLTGAITCANSGGKFPATLRRSGIDMIIFTGKASTPVYLWIDDGEAEIRRADHLWGKNCHETETVLKQEIGPEIKVASIGIAGEKKVLFASIMNDKDRAAGRSGVGAVMGSKNLKAMVAYGTMPLLLADEDALNASVKSLVPHVRDATDDFRRYGTSGGVEKYEYIGNLPIKNWQGSRWKEGAEKISGVRMHDTILTGNKSCRGCVISCVRHVKIEEGPYAGLDTDGPEYETIGTLGGECLVDDLDAICKANELCNRYGLDTISTGAAIAFGMEAYEKGLITKEDTEGLELVWGNAEAMVEMVHRIAKGENVGKLLGLGTKKAAEVLGRNAIEFSVQVKGLEPSAHDPRRFWTQALSYATAARGACHNRSWGHPYELGLSLPELGLDKPQKSYELEGLAEYVAKLQNFQTLNDTLVICRFAQVGSAVSLAKTVEWYNMITGFDLSVEELVVVGERIFNLKRMFNVRLGISRKDDFLPPRFMTLNRKDKELNTQLPPIGEMLGDFYEYRGWDEIGIPTEEKLAELELSELNA